MCPHCRCSRKKRFGVNDWLTKHAKYVQQWEATERVFLTNGAWSMANEYHEYLAWLHMSTRIHVHPPVSSIPINEADSDEEDPYDLITRVDVQPQRAPLQNYIVRISFELCLDTSLVVKYILMMLMQVL